MADCKKCRFRSICKKRPTMEGATIAECDLFRDDIERTEPMTNADRIRAMSDDELADFLGMSSICQRIQQEGIWCEDHGSCSDCLREWLEQHAEEVR